LRPRTAASRTGALQERVLDAERRAIADALERNGGNRQAAAKELGMHRATLFRKIKAFGMN
jgi:transcriptional regulator with PAS, ATPase and Fis domain